MYYAKKRFDVLIFQWSSLVFSFVEWIVRLASGHVCIYFWIKMHDCFRNADDININGDGR